MTDASEHAIGPGSMEARVERVRERVRGAGGDPDRVRLVAVTKGFPVEVAEAAARAGLTDLGENYAQELEAKAPRLSGGDLHPRWHFLGRLQTNKVRKLGPVVSLWQSVDREEVVDEIAKRVPGAAVLVQVNLSYEPQKGGCTFAAAPALVSRATSRGLGVRGLMGVAPAGGPEDARAGFRRLVALADDLGLAERSIGMSADLEVAVQEGSTMIRIGRDLFGPRPPR